jgi:hypothetical protein
LSFLFLPEIEITFYSQKRQSTYRTTPGKKYNLLSV